jgi:hypothetical protein
MHTSAVFACAIALASFAAAAHAAPPDVMFSQDGHVAVVTGGNAATTPGILTPGLKPIFSNLASLDPNGVYMADTGYTVSGGNSQFWYAAAFTPTANATAAEIDIGATYISGKKPKLELELYADDNGLPGQELWSGDATIAVNEVGCCALTTAKIKGGIALTAGTQYWVGVSTLANGPDTMAIWNFNVTDQVDAESLAENQGSGWVARSWLPGIAFGVFAKP